MLAQSEIHFSELFVLVVGFVLMFASAAGTMVFTAGAAVWNLRDGGGAGGVFHAGGGRLSNGWADSCMVPRLVLIGQQSAHPPAEHESVRSTALKRAGQSHFVSDVRNQKHDPGTQHRDPESNEENGLV